jgi:RNA polymerase-associated protein LEO1
MPIQLHSLRVPDFIRWNPEEYKSDEYEPSQKEIAAAKADKLRPLVRFRRNRRTGDMETNTLIHRWSDGSLTISVGDEMFEIQSKSLAPPADEKYQEVQDAHYYAASASVASEALLVVGHITQQHNVRPNEVIADAALERLIGRMEEAQHGTPTDMIIQTKQDPELQKKQAELAEKERLRLQRKRETAAARLDGLGNRYPRGALSINDLEGGGRRPPGSGRKRGAPGAPRQKRRRPEYDSDDDLPPGGRQDDYDLEDDFIAKSDEEISGEGEDDDEEDVLDDDDEEEEERAPRTKRQKTAEAEDDADGEADLDDVDAPAHSGDASRNRRRNIIQDDDEE